MRRFLRHRAAAAGAVVIVVLAFVAIAAPWISPHDPVKQDYNAVMKPPSRQHPFGTDQIGRDLLARTIYGTRVSLFAGVISVGIALAIGLPVGLMSGYYRGVLDEVFVMRIVDGLQAFPFLILALALAAALGPGFFNAMAAVGIGIAPGFIRLIRGQVLAQREQDYVVAARATGASDARIMVTHILPNIMAPILVQATLAVAAAIIAEATLSYLGLGVQPPTPSWGSSLRVAQGYLNLAPWMAYWPGAAIFLAVLAFNVMGDGLRDMLDPRLRGE